MKSGNSLRHYFSAESLNTGRQPELDMVKAIALLFMILFHSYDAWGTEYYGPGLKFFALLQSLSGAGCFMVCMGINMCYARHHTPKAFLLRGLALLTVSQLVNLLRISIPGLIAYHITGKERFVGFMLDAVQSDILTFAGLAFLMMALLTALRLRKEWIFAVGMMMNLLMIPLALSPESMGGFWTNRLLSLLIRTDSSLFPLCTHFVFVAFGYLAGSWYRRIADKDALAKRILRICVPIAVIYYTLRLSIPFSFLPDFHSVREPSMGTDAIGVIMNTLIFLVLCHKAAQAWCGGSAPAFLLQVSKNMSTYYCVSDILLGITATVLFACGGPEHGNWLPALYALLVIAVCRAVAGINEHAIHFSVAKLSGSKAVIIYFLIWGATLAMALYASSLSSDPAMIASAFA